MKNKDEINNFHHLLRGIILIGFMLFLFKLLLTGNITLLIAPKMVRLIYFTLFVLLTLGVLLIIRGTSDQKHLYHCDCDGDHSYPTSLGKSLFLYLLFIIPITTGFLFANNVLDSSVAMNRTIKIGASLPDVNQNKKKSEQPNSSSDTDDNSLPVNSKNDLDDPPEPLTKTQYNKLKQDMLQTKNINFNDRSYVPMMTIIQDNLQSMLGKTVSTKGFVYREKNFMQNQIIVARFGISCCVADASVFGMMAKGDVAALPKDTWVQVSGTIEQTKYDGGTIPFIKIKKISIIAAPKQPYVFDVGVKIE